MTDLRKTAKLDSLLASLMYQYPRFPAITTHGTCSVDGCNNSSRGSRACPSCLEKELADFLGDPPRAEQLHRAIRHTSELIQETYESL